MVASWVRKGPYSEDKRTRGAGRDSLAFRGSVIAGWLPDSRAAQMALVLRAILPDKSSHSRQSPYLAFMP